MKQGTSANLDRFVSVLTESLGSEKVLVDADSLEFYSVDLSEQRLASAAIVTIPESADEVIMIMKLAYQFDIPIVPRGAGLSFSLGTVPKREGSVVIDMHRMNRILDIDFEGLHITVEPGVTWAQIQEALSGADYAIPWVGPMGGIKTTVGGALGNNTMGHGKGDSAKYLLGFEVVLPDGRIVQTGALAIAPEHPGLRSHGPDFTDLFVNDGGAFGIKTKVSFRLERRLAGTAFACFGFERLEDVNQAVYELGHLSIVWFGLAFDRRMHHQWIDGQSTTTLEQKRALIKRVMRNSSNVLVGARNLISLARGAGLGFLADWPHSINVTVEGIDQRAAESAIRLVKRTLKRIGGKPLPPILSIFLRNQPFNPIEELFLGPEGEVCFPTNWCLSLSQGAKARIALDAFFKEHESYLEEHGISWGILMVVADNQFGIEPIFYYKDRLSPLRYSLLSADQKQLYGNIPDNPGAREAATKLRAKMVREFFPKFRGVHYHVNKYYPYKEVISDDCWSLVEDFKNCVDPKRLMNPGSLGLD